MVPNKPTWRGKVTPNKNNLSMGKGTFPNGSPNRKREPHVQKRKK